MHLICINEYVQAAEQQKIAELHNTLLSSQDAPMKGNELHGMLPILFSLLRHHHIHIKNVLPCQFQTSDVEPEILKVFQHDPLFLSHLILCRDPQDDDPIVLDEMHIYATFEGAKHQFVVFLEQIAVHESYICIEVSR